jgi:alanyl-tRNA synthetase
MSGVNEIRSAFLDYFAREGHEVVPSSPLVPRNDPTLMFTNAGHGAVQERLHRPRDARLPRATTAQKCVRAGGKHNDLDNVGYTARHHTFFEMLGNFSFGDYFKERAIELAWRLVTREFGLDAERLVVTVYRRGRRGGHGCGRSSPGFGDDKHHQASPPATISGRWATAAPADPCSEIFYDHGPSIPGGPPASPDADGDRFIEIWNLVFMQFEQVASATASRCRSRRSIPAWASSASRRCCRGHARQLRDRPVPGADPRLGGRSPGFRQRRARRASTASSPTTCARRAS